MGRQLTRRRVLGATAAAGLGSVPAGSATATADRQGLAAVDLPESWPLYQYDPANTGRPPGASGPGQSVATAWCTAFRTSSRNAPVAAGDALYHGGWGTMGALDPATGEVRWTSGVDASRLSTPVVAGGSVYATSLDGRLHSFDAATGEREWTVGLAGTTRSAPAVADGTVFATADSGMVRAVDAGEGAVLWTTRVGSATKAPPQVVGDTVYVSAGAAPTAVALDATTGERRWTYDYTTVGVAPAVADGVVYLVDGIRVLAVDAATGEERWVHEPEHDPLTAPTVVDGTLYVGTAASRDDGYVLALDPSTRERRWRYDALEGWIWGAVTVADGVVYAGSKDGTVHAVDAATGDGRWTYEVAGEVEAAPTVVDGTVLFASSANRLYALAAPAAVDEPATDCATAVDTTGRGATGNAPGSGEGPTGTSSRRTTGTTPADEGQGLLRRLWRGPGSLLALLLGVPVVGPLVLGALVWLVGSPDEEDGDDADAVPEDADGGDADGGYDDGDGNDGDDDGAGNDGDEDGGDDGVEDAADDPG